MNSDANDSESTPILIPDFRLRSRVAGADQTEADYCATGKAGVACMNDALAHVGRKVSDFLTVLDFGCGPARIIQYIHLLNGNQEIHGSDIDPESIDWCRKNIRYATFDCNQSLPPLKYPDLKFDFIYALSVFSHLNKEMQRAWLQELFRLLQVDGYFYLTFSGRHVFDKFPPAQPAMDEFTQTGFVFINNMGDVYYKYPEWYQTSLQEIKFIANELPKSLQIVYYASRGHQGLQDALLCTKRA